MTLTASDLWTRTHAAVQARFADHALVAAAFAFLPNVVAIRFLPDSHLAMIAVGLISYVGQIAIMRMVIAQGMDTGDSIRSAFPAYLPAIGLMFLVGLATFIGILAFIVPGLYILARLTPALPLLLASGDSIDTSLRRAWAMTDGKVMPILGVALAFIVIFLISAFIVGAIAALISGSDRMSLLGAVLLSAVAGTFSVYYSVMQAVVWRALSPAR